MKNSSRLIRFIFLTSLPGLTSCGFRTQQTQGANATPTPTVTVTTTAPSPVPIDLVPVLTPVPVVSNRISQPIEPTPTPEPSVVVVVPAQIPTSLVTQANLDRVHKEMRPSEVRAILGEPTSSSSMDVPILGSETTYKYESGNSSILIVFRNNRVNMKSGNFGVNNPFSPDN